MSLLHALPVAHALVARKDLPIPAWLFAWGASIVLIVSFFALSAAWREPRFEEERWRPLGAGLSRALLGMPAQVLCGAIGVFLLGVSVYAGLHGTEAPDRNFAITFLFVTAWLGFPLFSVLFGDVFQPFNPWRAIGRVGRRRLPGGRRPALRPPPRIPERLGRWPAAIGLIAFVWLEIVYGASGGVAVGLAPHAAGVAALVYTVYTLAMMALFGVEEWCERGEIFSVYFGMFSRLGCFGVERRPARAGAGRSRRRPLGDGARLGGGGDRLDRARPASTGPRRAPSRAAIEQHLQLARRPRLRPGRRAAHHRHDLHGALLRRRRPRLPDRRAGDVDRAQARRRSTKLRSGFAHTLIPIAFAYLVAHYFSLFVFQEQAQFTYLLSDPLGTATTDLFGTASGGIDFTRDQRQRDLVRAGRRAGGRPRRSASCSPTTAPPPTGATTARPPARSTGCWR